MLLLRMLFFALFMWKKRENFEYWGHPPLPHKAELTLVNKVHVHYPTLVIFLTLGVAHVQKSVAQVI